jgi:hypothetical protein
MKVLFLLLSIASVTICQAQTIKTDSSLDTRQLKTLSRINGRITSNKAQLVTVHQQFSYAQEVATAKLNKAKASAQDNQDEAYQLAADVRDKAKARRAERAAIKAADDAKDARQAFSKVEKLQRQSQDLKSRIARDSTRIAAITEPTPESVN